MCSTCFYPLVCVCVFQRLVWKSEEHISQNVFPRDSSSHSISDSFNATSFRSGESGGILSTTRTLGLGSPYTGSLQQLPQTSQAIPALGWQVLVVSLHIIQLLASLSSVHFFFFLIFTIYPLEVFCEYLISCIKSVKYFQEQTLTDETGGAIKDSINSH